MQTSSNVFIAKIENNKAFLPEEESFHCCKVLRKKAGDLISVIDGKGRYFEAVLEKVTEKHCVANLTGEGRVQRIRNYRLHLAIAPTKQIDRTEWLIEKIVELGIDEISLMRCQNSERVQANTQRLRKIIESAVKQSLQAKIPELHDMVDFSKILDLHRADQKLLAHCQDGEKKKISELNFMNKTSLVLIGPEGDFSRKEIDMAIEKGFAELSLGENRLRTETAGLVLALAGYLNAG